MIIGVPTEVKTREYRVGMVPAGVRTLSTHGHKVIVQAGAGLGSGISDDEFRTAGAELVSTAEEVWRSGFASGMGGAIAAARRCGQGRAPSPLRRWNESRQTRLRARRPIKKRRHPDEPKPRA